jgi:hypothetical protein
VENPYFYKNETSNPSERISQNREAESHLKTPPLQDLNMAAARVSTSSAQLFFFSKRTAREEETDKNDCLKF